jgi:hypothetical protein
MSRAPQALCSLQANLTHAAALSQCISSLGPVAFVLLPLRSGAWSLPNSAREVAASCVGAGCTNMAAAERPCCRTQALQYAVQAADAAGIDARGIRHRRRSRPPPAAPAVAANPSANGADGAAGSPASGSGSNASDGSAVGSESSNSDADSAGSSNTDDQLAAEDVEDLVLAARQAVR